MAHRQFVDKGGVPWQVWEVKPQWADRRSGTDRRHLSIDDPGVDPPVLEQRRGHDRRDPTPPRVPRVRMADGFSAGWLAFESEAERRRLAPIPPNWEAVSEAELAALCAKASATAPHRGRLRE